MFYKRQPKQRSFRKDLKNIQPRFSDAFSRLETDNVQSMSEKMNEFSTSYLHTPGITFGIRPGLGKPIHICDCSKPVTAKNHYIASNSVLTALVSIQYLTLMCTTYCHKKLKAKRNKHAKQSNAIGNWKPSYIPYKERNNSVQFRDTNFSDTNNGEGTKNEAMVFLSKSKQNPNTTQKFEAPR